MDLQEGQARIEVREEGMDPREIPAAIRKAGFSPREIEIVAVGEVVRSDRASDSGVWLRLAGPLPQISLVGDGSEALEAGARVRVVGYLEEPENGEEGGFRLRVLEHRPADEG